MGQTQNFFAEKKPWSILKDRILEYYLVPYIAKLLTTGKPLILYDCFAGKGQFSDGKPGSPLIIAKHIKTNLEKNQRIKGYFIEKKYHAELKQNLNGFPNADILAGTFEENIQKILSEDQKSNLFLYIDPYGIKSLNFNNFVQLRDNRFASLEMLMNFNTVGFLREGCRLLTYNDTLDDQDIPDYEIDDERNSIEKMDSVAGGNYWQKILNDFYKREITFAQAENRFISEYSKKIKTVFKYSVNIPIKVKSRHLPKYRLVFGSNNEGGLILMADNMHKKWQEMISGDQQILFEFEFPDFTLMNGFDLRKDILAIVAKNSKGLPLQALIVELIEKYGITFSESDYKKEIQEMAPDQLEIERQPAFTKKTGKPAISMDYNKYKITVRGKS